MAAIDPPAFSHPDCDRRLPARGSTVDGLAAAAGSWAGARTAGAAVTDHRSGLPPDPEGEAYC